MPTLSTSSLIALSLIALLAPAPLVLAQDDGAETQPSDDQVDTTDESTTDDEAGLFGSEDVFRLKPTIVTARKWSELAKDVPGSLRVLDADFLRDSGARSIRDASLYVPNLHIQEFTSRRLSFPTIRGVGAGIGDPAVVTYIDGVPQLSVSSTNIPLLDIDRIEFLRGPQGTLYGRSAEGGVINIHSRRPSNTPTVFGETTIGNYDLREFTLGYSGPLVEDKLYLSITGFHSERDGYTTNTITGRDVDHRHSLFGRAQVLWTPDDRNEIRFTAYGEDSEDGGFALSSVPALKATSHTIAQDFDGEVDRDIIAGSITWNHYGDAVEFTSISSYTDWDIRETSDFDFSPIDGVRRETNEEQGYFYQEFRLASAEDSPLELADNADLRWLIGGSLFSSDTDRSAANDFRPGGAGILFSPMMVGVDTQWGNFDDLGLALFGQATATINDKLDLTAGLRVDYEDKEATVNRSFAIGGFPVTMSSTSSDVDYTEFLPTFSIAYHVNDQVMIYGSAARGFRAGGFNLAAPTSRLGYGPERSWTFEAGAKTQLWDDRLAVNASVFYIDWDNRQLSLFDPVVGGFVDNAGSADATGFEIEVFARPTDGVDLFAGVGLTDSEINGFVDPFGMDVSGNNIANVPELTWNLGAQVGGDLTSNITWFVRGEYSDVGTFYYDAGNLGEERYAVLNFRAGIEINEQFRIEGWIRNALDDEYIPVAFQPSPVDPTSFVGENGAPMTYGVRASMTF